MAINSYFISAYYYPLVVILLMVIGSYSIDGH
jgi:hypothetical protein